MPKIAILVEDDPVWALSAWERTIPALIEQGHEVAGLWRVNPKLANIPEDEVTRWYLKVFGPFNFFLLGLLFVCARGSRVGKSLFGRRARSFEALCAKHGVHYAASSSPNNPEIAAWIRENEIDIAVIMVSHIVKEPLLSAPRIGILNKHAAALPANKGMMPYIWAVIDGTPQGITFHQIDAQIDEGHVCFQEVYEAPRWKSMIHFYAFVFARYHRHLLKAIDALTQQSFVLPRTDLADSYYSLPTREDIRHFQKRGGKIIRIRDVFTGLSL